MEEQEKTAEGPVSGEPESAETKEDQPTPEVDSSLAGDEGSASESFPSDVLPSGPAENEAVEDGGEPRSSEPEAMVAEDLLSGIDNPSNAISEDTTLKAVLEAIIYVTEEPLTIAQISAAIQQPKERVRKLLDELVAEFERPDHGLAVREVAGGYKMTTKPEHHEAVRCFVKSLKPPLKLSLPALETLAVIAYKQPVTGPEIMEIRGVQGAGVLKTLLDRKLIAVAGRKNVIGKPILYKTTKDFMVQFGLKDLSELPSLKEFEEIRRMALFDSEPAAESPAVETPAEPAQASAPEPEIASERQTASEPEEEAGAGSEPPQTVER